MERYSEGNMALDRKEQYIRTQMLLGEDGMKRLEGSRVAIFGIGGVGGHAAEALARSGVGKLDLIDHDEVALSNLNRQLVAAVRTIGRAKVEVMKERILDIAPDCCVNEIRCFYLPQLAAQFDWKSYDYIVDALDTVTAKIDLAVRAQEHTVAIISCMGAGNKLDPTAFEVADIYDTSVCPLARIMRRELKKKGVTGLKVVYSREEPVKPRQPNGQEQPDRRAIPGSTAFVPSVAGLIMAGEVVRDLAGIPRSLFR